MSNTTPRTRTLESVRQYKVSPDLQGGESTLNSDTILLTGCGVHHVHFHWEEFLVDPMLRWRMEVELLQRISLPAEGSRAVAHDDLHRGAEIFEFSGLDIWD
jgi:hypothetical protein